MPEAHPSVIVGSIEDVQALWELIPNDDRRRVFAYTDRDESLCIWVSHSNFNLIRPSPDSVDTSGGLIARGKDCYFSTSTRSLPNYLC